MYWGISSIWHKIEMAYINATGRRNVLTAEPPRTAIFIALHVHEGNIYVSDAIQTYAFISTNVAVVKSSWYTSSFHNGDMHDPAKLCQDVD